MQYVYRNTCHTHRARTAQPACSSTHPPRCTASGSHAFGRIPGILASWLDAVPAGGWSGVPAVHGSALLPSARGTRANRPGTAASDGAPQAAFWRLAGLGAHLDGRLVELGLHHEGWPVGLGVPPPVGGGEPGEPPLWSRQPKGSGSGWAAGGRGALRGAGERSRLPHSPVCHFGERSRRPPPSADGFVSAQSIGNRARCLGEKTQRSRPPACGFACHRGLRAASPCCSVTGPQPQPRGTDCGIPAPARRPPFPRAPPGPRLRPHPRDRRAPEGGRSGRRSEPTLRGKGHSGFKPDATGDRCAAERPHRSCARGRAQLHHPHHHLHHHPHHRSHRDLRHPPPGPGPGPGPAAPHLPAVRRSHRSAGGALVGGRPRPSPPRPPPIGRAARLSRRMQMTALPAPIPLAAARGAGPADRPRPARCGTIALVTRC